VAAFDWLSRRGKPADTANSRGRRPGSPWAAAAVGQRRGLAEREAAGEIAARGKPAPVQASKRSTRFGGTNGKLRWCAERRRFVVVFWRARASAATEDGAEAAAEVGWQDVGHRSDRSHVERLGVGAIHCVSGAEQAPVEIFNFAAHPPTLCDTVPSLWIRSHRCR
jgi:hypothetical protein